MEIVYGIIYFSAVGYPHQAISTFGTYKGLNDCATLREIHVTYNPCKFISRTDEELFFFCVDIKIVDIVSIIYACFVEEFP